jgi:hypothetical protein
MKGVSRLSHPREDDSISCCKEAKAYESALPCTLSMQATSSIKPPRETNSSMKTGSWMKRLSSKVASLTVLSSRVDSFSTMSAASMTGDETSLSRLPFSSLDSRLASETISSVSKSRRQ